MAREKKMLFQANQIDYEDLTALRFRNAKEFWRASEIVVKSRIQVFAPGHNTLIIQKSDKKFFEDLDFTVQKVANPKKQNKKNLS
jgi:hypothetical protein